ncbi:MAG: hypothetical protein P1U87_14395 [Verrucomicrobiales bacterium]|nr:hypothetical protein [Verrucomicrobiales bacterium]
MSSAKYTAGCFLILSLGILFPGLADAAESAKEVEAFDWRAFLAPFHTVTLHMPIGFVVMAVILEIYSFFRPSEPLRKAIGIVLLFSALSAVVVVLLGIFRASGGGYEPETLEEHRWYGIAVGAVTTLVYFAHLFGFRKNSGKGGAVLYRSLLLVDSILLVIAGHGGGNLTHGSKYLYENAPEWVVKWVEPEREGEGSASVGSGEYAEVIQPIFEKKCYPCHGPEKQKGDYRMDTVEGLFTAGESELDPIVKGVAVESYLVETITLPEEDDLAMPPEGKERLTPEETIAIMRWIWSGARTE